MTEEKKKTVLSLGAGARPKLELKKQVAPAGSSETVRQSFSHGRSKAVVVEAKKPAKRGEGEGTKGTAAQTKTTSSVNKSGRSTSAVLHTLTAEEREARVRALRGAVTEPVRSEHDYFQAEVVRPPVEPEAPSEPLTRDALRQRELKNYATFRNRKKQRARATSRKTKSVTAICKHHVGHQELPRPKTAAAALWRVREKACRDAQRIALRQLAMMRKKAVAVNPAEPLLRRVAVREMIAAWVIKSM